MATTEPDRPRNRNLVAGWVLAGLVVLAGGMAAYHYLTRPPQMGVSEEVFETVDALFTAVGGRDEKRLGECERRLHGHREAGKLPPAAGDALDAIIAKARSGSWETAAERLYDFMLAQRRDGATRERPPARDKTGKAAKGMGQ